MTPSQESAVEAQRQAFDEHDVIGCRYEKLISPERLAELFKAEERCREVAALLTEYGKLENAWDHARFFDLGQLSRAALGEGK